MAAGNTAVKEASDLPASVKVGRRVYAIEEWDVRGAVGADRYGECAHTEATIRICTIYGQAQAASTLLHEILHAVWAMWRLRDDDNEERTVGALENGIATVWLDNPQVFAWIGAGLASGVQT